MEKKIFETRKNPNRGTLKKATLVKKNETVF